MTPTDGSPEDIPDSSVHKWKSFINTTYSPTFTFFFTYNKQYLDTLHIQLKKEMHLRMHNNYFDKLLRSVH